MQVSWSTSFLMTVAKAAGTDLFAAVFTVAKTQTHN